MSLLARAHAQRMASKPQPTTTPYVGPVDPRFGHLPGWVAELTRKHFPDYARGL